MRRIPQFLGHALLGLALLPWLSQPAWSGIIQVPLHYAQLQDAIDAAAPGDVILIQGGTYENVVIDKPIFLAGHATDRPLFTPLEWDGSQPFTTTSALTLAGPGQGAVTLSGIDFGGVIGSVFAQVNDPAIIGGGFDELRLLHCDVHAPTWVDPQPGDVRLPVSAVDVDVSWLVIEDSVVRGTEGFALTTWSDDTLAGGEPCVASTGDVCVVDSDLRGLDGLISPLLSPGLNCSKAGGVGGAGVKSPGTLYQADSLIVGGSGAMAFLASSGDLICDQPDGPAANVGAQIDGLGSALTSSGPAVSGSLWTLSFEADDDSVLLVSASPSLPISVGAPGLLFMDPAKFLVFPVTGVGTVALDVEITASHGSVGRPVVCQVYSPSLGLSRPVFASILLP